MSAPGGANTGGPIISDEPAIAVNEEELEGIAPDTKEFPDNFYRGLIAFLDLARGRGTIRSYSGREIHFQFPFVTVAGAPLGGKYPGIDRIRQGDVVGFDVGWTSKGLRVTHIKPAR
jgi:hypothetical protein